MVVQSKKNHHEKVESKFDIMKSIVAIKFDSNKSDEWLEISIVPFYCMADLLWYTFDTTAYVLLMVIFFYIIILFCFVFGFFVH